MIARVEAAQATLDAARSRPYKLGVNDCARMTAGHLRRMGKRVKLPPSRSYGTARGALRALKERGFGNLIEAMDGFGFERIAPAAALPGDVLALPTESPLGCLVVALGNGRVCGFHEDVVEGCVLQPLTYEAAWRINLLSPRKKAGTTIAP